MPITLEQQSRKPETSKTVINHHSDIHHWLTDSKLTYINSVARILYGNVRSVHQPYHLQNE